MAKVEKITDLIGNTPIVRINRINDGGAEIYAKLESFNPLHSIKDRTAMALIEGAEKEGKIKQGSVIIEATSGNTGIGLACICAVKGYRIILCMPETMSSERKGLLKALGAELELTAGSEGMKGAIERANELATAIPLSFIPQQFSNPHNPEIHEKTTGPEIWKDTDGCIDFLVAGVGTGGTITGTGKYLKSRNPAIRIIGVEPAASPVLSGGNPGQHQIQGIGAGFIPENYDESIVDEIIKIDDDAAFVMSQRLAKEEGIFVCISSGAAMKAAMILSMKPENKGKTIVVIFPDTGDRYLSVWRY